MLRLSELIKQLQDVQAATEGDPEVRLMTSPKWPFENEIAGVTTSSKINAACDDIDEMLPKECEVVYVVEAGQVAYGSKKAFELCEVRIPRV